MLWCILLLHALCYVPKNVSPAVYMHYSVVGTCMYLYVYLILLMSLLCVLQCKKTSNSGVYVVTGVALFLATPTP